MSRRVQRVRYELDSGSIKKLSDEEIRMILRAADELISTGGRTMLVKILKGSKDKKVLEHKLDKCSAYGYYHSLTMDEISQRIDWTIKHDYLRIEYNYRLPVLVFSEMGWKIERETFTDELYQRFCQDVAANKASVILEMKDVNRQVVWDVLEKIRFGGDASFIPMLEAWRELEVKKVRGGISGVIYDLSPERKNQ